MEEKYTYKQVVAYATIGLNNLLHSGNTNNINLKDFANLFMEPLEKIHKKENVVEYAEKLEKEGMQWNL